MTESFAPVYYVGHQAVQNPVPVQACPEVLFGEDSSVYMRRAEAGNVLLRMAKSL